MKPQRRMPDMDGYEVCRNFMADNATAGIPVISLYAMDRTKDQISGLNLGAVDCITKPFQPEEVSARVEAHLADRIMRDVDVFAGEHPAD